MNFSTLTQTRLLPTTAFIGIPTTAFNSTNLDLVYSKVFFLTFYLVYSLLAPLKALVSYWDVQHLSDCSWTSFTFKSISLPSSSTSLAFFSYAQTHRMLILKSPCC